MDQYIALSKRDITLNITLNEVYGTHALLAQHKDLLCSNDSDHLKIILTDLGLAPPQVNRNENKSVHLPLFSRWESAIAELPSSMASIAQLTQEDILYMDTKALFIQILRAMPAFIETCKRVKFVQNQDTGKRTQVTEYNVNLENVFMAANLFKDKELESRSARLKELVTLLEEMNVIHADDGYKVLAEEVSQELAHLGSLRSKIDSEIESLKEVSKTIYEHNKYLDSQLSTYRAYLHNVRIQSSNQKTGSSSSSKAEAKGPFKFNLSAMEKEGVILDSSIPENKRTNVFLMLVSPQPGSFVISLNYKGKLQESVCLRVRK